MSGFVGVHFGSGNDIIVLVGRIQERICKMSAASALLHVHTGDDTQHEITADLLCQFVRSLQEMTYLVATAKMGMGNRKRIFGVSDLVKECQIFCELPKAGSYVLPFRIRNVARPLLDDSASVFSALMLALTGIASDDISSTVLMQLSTENRARFASAVSQMSAKRGKGWRVSIDTDASSRPEGVPAVFEFSDQLTAKAERMLNMVDDDQEEIMSVIGELISVNFENNTLSIRHHGTRKEICCSYRPEVVDQILQNRSRGVQVTGRFTLDDAGNPKSLSDVSSIVPVDLSSISVETFEAGGVRVRSLLNADVTFLPQLDEETKQLFVAENVRLGIDAYAGTRDDLIAEIAEQLAVNWLEYAKAKDEDLTVTAQELKRNLLSCYEEEAV